MRRGKPGLNEAPLLTTLAIYFLQRGGVNRREDQHSKSMSGLEIPPPTILTNPNIYHAWAGNFPTP